jgi:hypothetical protein
MTKLFRINDLTVMAGLDPAIQLPAATVAGFPRPY